MAEHELNKIVDDDGEVFNLRDSTKQPVADRVTAWGSTPSDTKYPSEKLVKDSLDGKVSDVKIDGTSVVSSGTANIPMASSSVKGVVKVDTAMSSTSTNPVQNKVVNTALSGKIPNFTRESQYFWDNTFCSGMMSGPGIVSIHDGFFCLDKRDYKITITKTINGVDTDLSAYASNLFNLYQDDYSALRFGGGTIKIEIERKTAGTYVWGDCGYPYGTYRIYHYAAMPASCTMRVKTNYPSQIEPGWHSLTVNSSTNGYQFWATNNYYNVEKLEIIVDATNLTSTSTVSPVILVFMPFRPNTSKADSHPVVRKYGAEKLYFPLTAPEFVGDLNGKLKNARKLAVDLANTSTDSSFDGSADVTNIKTTGTLAPSNGGTGKTSLKAAEYNLTTGKSEISDTTSGDDRVVFELASPSESNGVTRGFRKLSTIWTWIKGQISSVLGLSESGYSGNAATATKATQDSDGNAINATYFKSSGNTTLVAGAATKIGTQNGADVKLTLPAHQDISGKMNTSASNATAPSGSGGDGATATLLNNLTEGTSDIVTTDDGDNVLIATTDNGGSVTNKWYKRKLVKLIPWIIKKLGTRLVYDCGSGSTSGDDFDAALAAFNAGQWVIIHDSANVYYCAGTYNSGLRFKRLTSSASGISVNTLNWTRGSSPSAGSQLDASLSGHTHTRSDVTNFAHTHGNIQDGGALQTSDVTIASGDKLVITDSSDSGKVARASASFDGSTTTKALTQKGTFETFMTPSASNAASGALQNLTAQLSEGTSPFTDNTEIFTSYAGNNGFAEAGHVNQPYRRKASSMLSYIEGKRFITRSPATVDTATKRIQLGYGLYTASNVGCCCYLVHVFFNYVDDNLRGVGATLLVNYDWRFSSYQKAKCVILNDNGLRAAGYNIVLANFLTTSNDVQYLHITLGLVKNSAPTTLVSFSYSYCKIFYVAGDLNWTHSVTSDTIGTYNYLIQAEFEKADGLNTSVNVGSANQPVYFNNGVPTACNWWVS